MWYELNENSNEIIIKCSEKFHMVNKVVVYMENHFFHTFFIGEKTCTEIQKMYIRYAVLYIYIVYLE